MLISRLALALALSDTPAMAIDAVTKMSGRAVPLPGADVDTDRIIPARFLKCVTFADLAEGLFYDERFDTDGNSKGHPLDDAKYAGASIMVVGPNFGCGSSREHAPQSIKRSDYHAIIGVSYAEIFFGNSTGLGMPCVSMTPEQNEELMALVQQHPETEVSLDLTSMTVVFGEKTFSITMPDGAREALVSGKWDSIQELVDNEAKASAVAATLSYV